MTFEEYQIQALTTARYPNVSENLVYPVIGLCGEAGELANKFKKVLRDDEGELHLPKAKAIADELGDVLWYAAMIAYELAIPLEVIAEQNLAKLKDRSNRDSIRGEGDNR